MIPQLTNNTDLSYSIFDGKFITTLNYTYIANPIVWAMRPDPITGRFIGGFRNLDFQHNYGIAFNFNKKLYSWWTTNNNVVVNKNYL